MDILGIGECMIQLECDQSFYESQTFKRSAGGDVYNTLVTASKMGCHTGFLTKIAWDGFGHYLADLFKTHNISTEHIKTTKQGTNGLYFSSLKNAQAGGPHDFMYYRKGSAASQLSPDQITPELLEGVKVVYASGITQALSESARKTVLKAFQLAKKQGILVCYDPNFRSALWHRPDEALDALVEVISYIDVILPSVDDLQPMFNFPDIDKTLEYFRLRGVSLVALKNGRDGVTLGFKQWQKHIPAESTGKIVDTVGAGDAFNGGFIFGLLNGYSLEECGRIGNIIAAKTLTKAGPIEGLPPRAEVLHFVEKDMRLPEPKDQPKEAKQTGSSNGGAAHDDTGSDPDDKKTRKRKPKSVSTQS